MSVRQHFSTAAEADGLFRTLVESVADYAIYMLDCDGNVVTWNRGAELNKGYTSEEVLGRHFRMFFVPEDIENGVPEAEMAIALDQGRSLGEGWRMRKDGQRFWASFNLTAMRDGEGNHVGFAKITRDLTNQKLFQDKLRELEAAVRSERDTLRAAAESSLDALYICEAVRSDQGVVEDFVFTFVNSNAEHMLRVSRNELLGARMRQRFPSGQSVHLFELYRRVVETGIPLTIELSTEDTRFSLQWVRVQAVKLRDGVAITASDITQRKLDEARIAHLAHHDYLTGLPNRTLLVDRIERACALSRRNHDLTGVFLVDLDNFKPINDKLGHAVGDLVLKEVAKRLLGSVRHADSVIRFGGDEFVIVCSSAKDVCDLKEIARKLLVAIKAPISGLPEGFDLSCSVGIAVFRQNETPDDLLVQADTAMYLAKGRGRDQLAVFS